MASHDSRPRRRGANSERGFKPYHSVSVPKNQDLVHGFQADRPKTTVMLRNIPNRYSQVALLKEIDHAGFAEAYDFFYLPMDTKNRTNVGYAFINFSSSQDCDRFMQYFAGYVFPNCPTPKAARVSLAHIQGFIENIRHFSNRAVSHSRNSQYRPIVIHQGNRMDISDAYNLLCTVQAVQADLPEAPVAEPFHGRVAPELREAGNLGGAPGLVACAPYQIDSPPGLELPMQLSPMPPAPLMPSTPIQRPLPLASTSSDFSEAKRGLEEAVSMLLASYHHDHPAEPDDDEQTDCEASSPATPRPGIAAKWGLPCDEEVATPRTNKTLFVHNRFSA